MKNELFPGQCPCEVRRLPGTERSVAGQDARPGFFRRQRSDDLLSGSQHHTPRRRECIGLWRWTVEGKSSDLLPGISARPSRLREDCRWTEARIFYRKRPMPGIPAVGAFDRTRSHRSSRELRDDRPAPAPCSSPGRKGEAQVPGPLVRRAGRSGMRSRAPTASARCRRPSGTAPRRTMVARGGARRRTLLLGALVDQPPTSRRPPLPCHERGRCLAIPSAPRGSG